MAQFTKKVIIDAFFKLLSEKSFDKITVKDIVDECQINRNTFYYYYEDIYDLVENIFQIKLEEIAKKELTQSFEEEFKQNISNVLKYRPAIENMYHSKERDMFIKYLEGIADNFADKYIRKRAENFSIPSEDLELLIACYSASICGIVSRWVQNDSGLSLDVFVHKLSLIYENSIDVSLKAVEEYCD